jgi:hypothetical protein
MQTEEHADESRKTAPSKMQAEEHADGPGKPLADARGSETH